MSRNSKVTIGVVIAAIVGFIQGVGIEKVMAEQLIDALHDGDWPKVLGWLLVFGVIWLEVRGMKRELKTMNETIGKGFTAGERRFENVENNHVHLVDRVSAIEAIVKVKPIERGGDYGKSV